MKQLIFLLFSLVIATAWAQAPAKDAAKPEVTKEAAKPSTDSKLAAATPRKPRRWHEDARHCLELPTNTEVIKCAEEYV